MTQQIEKKCLILVPMKDPSESKSRLGPGLNATQRQNLSKLLYKRSLEVLVQVARTRGDAQVAVVTSSQYAAKTAKQYGASIITEDGKGSLSTAVDAAAQWANNKGFSTLCVIPADLVAPDADEISKIISVGMERKQPVICPSTDLGTNAILVSPPNLIKFSYGKQSFWRHRERLEAAGQVPILMPLESLRFDIDTHDCLQKAVREHSDFQLALGKIMS